MHPQAKATALIEILRDALHQVETDSVSHTDDPQVCALKTSILTGIAALESVRLDYQQSQAA